MCFREMFAKLIKVYCLIVVFYLVKLKFLSDEESEFLNKYLQNLGRTDKDSQLNLLNSFEPELEKFIHSADNKSKTYRPLCVKLGFLLGLIIFILLI